MSQQWKKFKQRFYRNLNTLSLCSPELLSGNLQSENVATVEIIKQRYCRYLTTLILCRLVLRSCKVPSENVAAVEIVQTTILSEP